MFGIIGLAISAAALPMAGVSVPTAAESSALSAAGMGQTATAQQDGQGQSAPDPYLAKFHLFAQTLPGDQNDDGLDGSQVFLREGRLVLGKPGAGDGAHPFSGFFVDYPFRQAPGDQGSGPKGSVPRGLVSTISYDPPNLNWIFVHRDTMALSYGNKTASLPHVTDPWGFSADGRWLQLNEDKAGFIAVRDPSSASWIIHYDMNDDLLESCASCIAPRRDRVEIDLERRLI